MSKKKYYLVNFSTYKIDYKELDTDSSYYEYSKPWRFDSINEAKEAIKERIKRKIKNIDKEIEKLNSEREDLVNKLFNI